MEKSVEATLLERRSIRRYERQPIAEDDLRFIREAIRNTPTSYNGQQFSVIEVSDQDTKLRLAEIVHQKQMKTSDRVFLFLSDFNKIRVAARAKGIYYPEFQDTMDGLLVGTIDASLALMSAVVAASSRGIGTCPIGYARTADPKAISELLGLPDGVFVVCALAVGIPREMPDLKPKQPEDLLIFPNKYPEADLSEKLLAYDREFTDYHRNRSSNPTDTDWIGEICGYYREGLNYSMLSALRARGYAVDK